MAGCNTVAAVITRTQLARQWTDADGGGAHDSNEDRHARYRMFTTFLHRL